MNTTGFTLCYELLTSSLGIRSISPVQLSAIQWPHHSVTATALSIYLRLCLICRIAPEASTFRLGSILLRMMPKGKVQTKGILMSVLKTMANNAEMTSRRDILTQ